jgi:hypothetical protein
MGWKRIKKGLTETLKAPANLFKTIKHTTQAAVTKNPEKKAHYKAAARTERKDLARGVKYGLGTAALAFGGYALASSGIGGSLTGGLKKAGGFLGKIGRKSRPGQDEAQQAVEGVAPPEIQPEGVMDYFNSDAGPEQRPIQTSGSFKTASMFGSQNPMVMVGVIIVVVLASFYSMKGK